MHACAHACDTNPTASCRTSLAEGWIDDASVRPEQGFPMSAFPFYRQIHTVARERHAHSLDPLRELSPAQSIANSTGKQKPRWYEDCSKHFPRTAFFSKLHISAVSLRFSAVKPSESRMSSLAPASSRH